MKALVGSVIITLVFAAAARAQTDGVERFEILVQGATISSPGGEELRVGGGANPNEPGRTVRHGFSVLPDGCVWNVSRVVEPAADLGWAVEITPVRVVDDAVTFRLVWARTRDDGKASTQSRSDRELTLRPGESIPLDAVYRPCPSEPRTIVALLRVTVVRYPDPDTIAGSLRWISGLSRSSKTVPSGASRCRCVVCITGRFPSTSTRRPRERWRSTSSAKSPQLRAIGRAT